MEIKNGKKRSHWIWYIFPQIQGLGMTDISHHYAIADIAEANDYLMDQDLGVRLIDICKALLQLETNDAYQTFGSPDDLKLKSSMTLFDVMPPTLPVFRQVLDKFYGSERGRLTLALLAIKPS